METLRCYVQIAQTFVVTSILAIALSVVPAWADRIEATIPGTDFSLPATIGTFSYSIPYGSVVNYVTLFGPVYYFPAAPNSFLLEFDFNGLGALSLPMGPADTSFSTGSGDARLARLITGNTLELSVRCYSGPCPSTYTRDYSSGLPYWWLWIDYTPPPPLRYTFDGTTIDTETWELSAPLGNSTVVQDDALLITSDGTGGSFCNTPELFGPGAGTALRRKLAGDFDIQVDFIDLQGSAPNYAAYLNIYQDEFHQLHIKRAYHDDGSVNGIQTVAIVGGPDIIGSDPSYNPATSGTFRITRSGNAIQTFFDGALDFSLEAFNGPVIVSLVFGADEESGSVAFDNFVINSGTLEDKVLVCPVEVSIDIKPDGYPNSINLGSGGTVPVAILSVPDVFDATTVDPTTVRLAEAGAALKGTGTPMASFKDVDGDGSMDLVVQVSTNGLQLTEGDIMAVLTGMTFDGTSFRGTDSVRIVRSLPPSSCTPLPPGSISWWRGEDGVDSVGPNNGVLLGGTANDPGKVGLAFSFDGIDDLVEATDFGLPMGSAPRTLELWVKPGFDARAPFIYGNFEASDAYYAIVEGANACIGQWADPLAERCGKTDVTDGKWHYLALTYDGTFARLYVDGILEVVQKKVYATTSTGRAYIGSTAKGSEEYFAGLVDEVTVYSRALTPSEIRAIFTSGRAGKCLPVQECFPPPAGLTGWWPGDGNTDDVIGGRNAVLQGDATTGPGLVGEAFILDGDGDFVDVPHDEALNVGTGDFTVDLWVFFNDTAGEQVLVEKWVQRLTPSEEFPGSKGWTLTKLENNVLLLATAEGSGAEIGVASDILLIPAGTWTHVAATRQGSQVTLFMNGVPVAQGESPLNLNSSSSLKFGHRGSPSDTPDSEDDRGFFLNGRVDEVELFVGQALTNDQIQAIFNARSAGKCK